MFVCLSGLLGKPLNMKTILIVFWCPCMSFANGKSSEFISTKWKSSKFYYFLNTVIRQLHYHKFIFYCPYPKSRLLLSLRVLPPHCLFPGSTLQQPQQHQSARALFYADPQLGPVLPSTLAMISCSLPTFHQMDWQPYWTLKDKKQELSRVQVGYCTLGGQIT